MFFYAFYGSKKINGKQSHKSTIFKKIKRRNLIFQHFVKFIQVG
jgi:hypothetical protein